MLPTRTVITIIGIVVLLAGSAEWAEAQGEEGEEEEAASVRGAPDDDEEPGGAKKKGGDEEGDDDDDDDGPGANILDEDGGKKSKKRKKGAKAKKGKKARRRKGVRVRARVFVRNTMLKNRGPGTQWQNDLDIASARLNLDIRKYGWLRASLEAEMSGRNVDLKDVYMSARVFDDFTIKVGNFKRPISPIALEGLWNLPLVERGILSDDITLASFDVPLNLGGRGVGGMVTYHGEGSVKPQIDVGLFSAELPGGSGATADNLVRDVYVRGRIEPIPGFQVGGSLVAFTQVRFAGDLRTRVLGSLDIALSTDAFRIWLEGFSGRTPFFDGTESVGALSAFRFLAAPKFKDPIEWVQRVEPFVMVSALELSDEKQDDRGFEIGGGATAYFRKQIRLQLEYTRAIYEDNFPQDPAMGVSFLDSHTIRLQVGVRLR